MRGQDVQVGLFGTCNNSKWRKSIIKRLKKLGIGTFDPQCNDWDKNEMRVINEKTMLVTLPIIVVNITKESKGIGSIMELTFCLVRLLSGAEFDLVVCIDQQFDDGTKEAQYNREVRRRVKKYVKSMTSTHLFLVEDEKMLAPTIESVVMERNEREKIKEKYGSKFIKKLTCENKKGMGLQVKKRSIKKIETKRKNNEIIVNLFGTCGNSTWRQEVEKNIITTGIRFFDPTVSSADFKVNDEKRISEEYSHLDLGKLNVFNITSETLGLASMAEVLFATCRAAVDVDAWMIMHIDTDLNQELKEDKILGAKASLVIEFRKQVLEYLRRCPNLNIILLEDEKDISGAIEDTVKLIFQRENTRKYCQSE